MSLRWTKTGNENMINRPKKRKKKERKPEKRVEYADIKKSARI